MRPSLRKIVPLLALTLTLAVAATALARGEHCDQAAHAKAKHAAAQKHEKPAKVTKVAKKDG